MKLLPLHCETTIDALTAKHTAFKSLAEMANAAGGYFPTLYVFRREAKIITDAYDKFQANRGDCRRASRITR
jgi:hypothetical protein